MNTFAFLALEGRQHFSTLANVFLNSIYYDTFTKLKWKILTVKLGSLLKNMMRRHVYLSWDKPYPDDSLREFIIKLDMTTHDVGMFSREIT